MRKSGALSFAFSAGLIRALTLSASVLTAPVKPFSVFVKVPMVAMVVLLVCCSGRDHRGLDGDREAGGDRDAPLAAEAAAEDGGTKTFLGSARNARHAQGKKVDGPPLRAGDRGVAGPRPDQPIRGSVVRKPGQTKRSHGNQSCAGTRV